MTESIRAIDASVILRYLLNDVPAQSEQARQIIESNRQLGLTAVALAEVAWTLTGPLYRRGRREVVAALSRFLALENVVALGYDKLEAQAALLYCGREDSAANFGDALIAACARSYGVMEIYTFDRRFARAGLTPVAFS